MNGLAIGTGGAPGRRTLEERALALLADPGARLSPCRDGDGYGVHPEGDRRRRPRARLSAAACAALARRRLLARDGDGYVLAARSLAPAPAPMRSPARPDPGEGALSRLAAIAGAGGLGWFSGREIAAARRLWEGGPRPRLPPGLEETADAFCESVDALAALEAARRWPGGGARLALKLALAALAELAD